MSTQTTRENTPSKLVVDTDLSKIFLGNNRSENDHYINNSSYDPKEIPAGTVMGRIGATGILVPWTSTATDGSQKVVGLLAHNVSIEAGENKRVTIVVSGDVAKEMVQFDRPGDAMETTVSNVRAEDKIKAETVGINLVVSRNMTNFDN